MVSVKEKHRGEKRYLYAERSIRLPDGTVKKFSKLIHERDEAGSKMVADHFKKQELEAYRHAALATYRPDHILTKEKLAKVETYRAEYRILIRALTPQQRKDLIDRFTVNFTYESNALEGNSLTLKDVAVVLMEERVPAGKELREVFETRNTREANELLFKKKIKIDIPEIVKLHALLTKETGVARGFKRFPNFLLMRDVQTTPPEKVEDEMRALVARYQESDDHPLRAAAEFHARFERIHPFEDGNGRVGRVLLNAILLENGYPPLIIRKTSRNAYLSALAAHDNNHADKLERFLLEKYEATFEKFFKIYTEYL